MLPCVVVGHRTEQQRQLGPGARLVHGGGGLHVRRGIDPQQAEAVPQHPCAQLAQRQPALALLSLGL